MKALIVAAVVITTLPVEICEADCKCPGDQLHGDIIKKRSICCSLRNVQQFECDWLRSGELNCKGNHLLTDVKKVKKAPPKFDPDYPAFYFLQRMGDKVCAWYTAINIMMNGLYADFGHKGEYVSDVDKRLILTEDNMHILDGALDEWPIKPAPGSGEPTSRYIETGDRGLMNGAVNDPLWPYVYPLAGLEIYPRFTTINPNTDYDNAGDYIYYDPVHNDGKTPLTGETYLFWDKRKAIRSGMRPVVKVKAKDFKAKIEQSNFVGIVLEVKSSVEGSTHHQGIWLDPRNPIGIVDENKIFWYSDPVYPILETPLKDAPWIYMKKVPVYDKSLTAKSTHRLKSFGKKLMRSKDKVEKKIKSYKNVPTPVAAYKRVGITDKGECENGPTDWCTNVKSFSYAKEHESQVKVEQLLGKDTLKWRGSKKLHGTQAVIDYIFDIDTKKSHGDEFLKKVWIITKPTHEELTEEFIDKNGVDPSVYLKNQWHSGAKKQNKALLVKLWPSIVLKKIQQRWVIDKKKQRGYWSEKKPSGYKKDFLDYLQVFGDKTGDPSKLEFPKEVQAMKQFEIIQHHKKEHSSVVRFYDYGFVKLSEIIMIFDVVAMLLLICGMLFCLGFITAYFMVPIVLKWNQFSILNPK